MPSELHRALAQITERSERLRSLLSDVQSRAPRRVTGVDARGAVRVVLGPDGLPVSFAVASDWQRRVTARAFGIAVVESFTVAARRRVAAWTKALEDDGWRTRLERLRAEFAASRDRSSGAGADPADAAGVPPAFAGRVPAAGPGAVPAAGPAAGFAAFVGVAAGRPQPLGALTEDALRTFEATQRLASTPGATRNPAAAGRSSGGWLVITLSANAVVSCHANQRWLPGQPAEAVTRALRQALAGARARLAEQAKAAQSARRETASELQRIYAEALGLLSDPHLLSESR